MRVDFVEGVLDSLVSLFLELVACGGWRRLEVLEVRWRS
jgi:hypothetical protein